MLSQTVEYALRAVVQLAAIAPKTSATAGLAAITQMPPAYLAKVLQALVKVDVVTSHRGASGGVALAHPPEKLTILDIVKATDPIERIRTCSLGLTTHGTRPCPLHRRLEPPSPRSKARSAIPRWPKSSAIPARSSPSAKHNPNGALQNQRRTGFGLSRNHLKALAEFARIRFQLTRNRRFYAALRYRAHVCRASRPVQRRSATAAR